MILNLQRAGEVMVYMTWDRDVRVALQDAQIVSSRLSGRQKKARLERQSHLNNHEIYLNSFGQKCSREMMEAAYEDETK